MNIADIPLLKAPAPHLRGKASFRANDLRDLSIGLLFSFAVCMKIGIAYAFLLAALLIAAVMVDFIFKILFIKTTRPTVDLEIIFQGMMMALFLNTKSFAVACAAGAMMAAFNRLCGGRQGRLFQPVCLTLGTLLIFELVAVSSGWALQGLPTYLIMVLIAVWFLIRRPRSRVEAGRMAAILIPVFVLKLLHILDWGPALLWCIAAGELVFDAAIFPLTVLGRRTHLTDACLIFIFSASVMPLNEAFAVTGLTAGFLAAWLEKRDLRRTHGNAFTR